MTLLACPECKAQISDTALSCPHCGFAKPGSGLLDGGGQAGGKVWPWVVGTPVVLFLLMILYGSTIPEYVSRAREAREFCEKLAPTEKPECRRVYDQAIADGKARGDK